MLLIINLYAKRNADKIWDYIVSNVKCHASKTVRPLYVSQIDGKNYISIIFDIQQINDIVRFLIDQIGGCDEIAKSRTFTLIKPVFLPIPRERTEGLGKFSIALKVEPKYYHDVYNELLEYRYGTEAFPTYISYSLGETDILMEMFAENFESVKNFVSDKICMMEGVTEYSIDLINRTQLIAEKERWRRLQKSLLHIPSWLASEDLRGRYLYDYELSVEDYARLTGAMVDEL